VFNAEKKLDCRTKTSKLFTKGHLSSVIDGYDVPLLQRLLNLVVPKHDVHKYRVVTGLGDMP